MENSFKEILWKQFGGSIDMLENAIKECPEELWDAESKFWYIAYHTLFFLDYYITTDPENFSPPKPFSLSEFNPDGEMPERVYSKEELINYLGYCRKKLQNLIISLTEESSKSRWVNSYRDYSLIEILLYNMRHVQHHAAQLNLLIRQIGIEPPDWVSQTKISL